MKAKTTLTWLATLSIITACGTTAKSPSPTPVSIAPASTTVAASLIPPVSITRDSSTTTTAATTTTLSGRQQIGQWYLDYGIEAIQHIQTDMEAVSDAAGDFDADELADACTGLVGHIADAQALPAIPHPGIEAHWRETLTEFRAGGAACVVGAQTGDASVIQEAIDHFDAGGEALDAATDEMQDA